MGLYVILTVFLFQPGSSESKDPDKKEGVDESEAHKDRRKILMFPYRSKKRELILMLYNHSLSLAFMLLFLISFVGHAVCGAKAHNEGGVGARQECGFCLAILRHLAVLVRVLPKLAKRVSGYLHHRRAVHLAAGKRFSRIEASCGCSFANRRLVHFTKRINS